jgi:predicted Fe-S protein YdhL (DUF1289 family)
VSRVSVPEAQVAKLGNEQRIRAHYQDEVRLSELLALAEQTLEEQSRWALMPPEEQQKLLAQRDAILAHGDSLCAPRPEDTSPLLRVQEAEARSTWAQAARWLRSLR